MSKILTIAIPTHNRVKPLSKNISLLLPQIVQYSSDVNLLISDNCSDDGTCSYVESLLKQYADFITYNRNTEDLGYLRNFGKGVELANSEYVYLLGDDDIVPPNFVSTIIHLLKENDSVGLLHFNYLQCSRTTGRLNIYNDRRLFKTFVECYGNFEDFVKEFLDIPSFMSSIVFKREIWLKGDLIFDEDCYGYDWLMKVYAGSLGYKCLYCSMPLMVQADCGINNYDDVWPLYSIVGKTRIFKHLDSDIPGLYEIWMKKFNKDLSNYRNILAVALYKDKYKSYYNEINGILEKRSFNILFKASLFVFPSWMCRILLLPLLEFLRKLIKL